MLFVLLEQVLQEMKPVKKLVLSWLNININIRVYKYIIKLIQNCSSVKKVFLKISQISQKTPVLESRFDKVAGLRLATLLKKDSDTGVFL